MSWLVKTEPDEYSYDTLVEAGVGCWDGVRNVEARNNLRKMKRGDVVLIYHTGRERSIVGLAEVVTEAYPDPTASSPIWSAVDLKALRRLPRPVSLRTLKALEHFADCPLVRRPRLSVMPLAAAHFEELVALGGGTS